MQAYCTLKLTKTPSCCHLITLSQLHVIIVSLYRNIITSSRPHLVLTFSRPYPHVLTSLTSFSSYSHIITYFHPHSHIVTSSSCPHTRSYSHIRVSPYPHLLTITSSHPPILILTSSHRLVLRSQGPAEHRL